MYQIEKHPFMCKGRIVLNLQSSEAYLGRTDQDFLHSGEHVFWMNNSIYTEDDLKAIHLLLKALNSNKSWTIAALKNILNKG